MKFCDRPYRFVYMEGYSEPGTVVMCPWMSYGVSREIGNVLKEDMYDIWHGKKAEALRKTIEDQSFRYCEKMSCPYLENDSLPDLSEEEFKKRAVPLEYPDQFNLAHDLVCNHKCPSCRYEIFKPDDEYVKNMKMVNEKIKPYLENATYIDACGLGDMFASPYMMDLLSSLDMKNESANLIFETNGVFCDEEHWERLSNLHKCKITIGVTPNSYDRATFKYLSGGLDDLEKVQHNLLFLKKLRQEGKLYNYYITIVIQEKNYRELPEFVERSLNEFGADNVVLRTIYKWNKMSAEDYWFKDVMNPLHPYHKDMLEVMKNPILKDKRIYNWTAFNVHPRTKHPAYRNEDYLKLTEKILKEDSEGNTLSSKLKEKGINEVIIYGDNTFTSIVNMMLQKDNYHVKYILARDKMHEKVGNVDVKCLDDYIQDENDTILISNYQDERYIRRDLSAIGYKGKIITVSALYDFVC